jgi:hypothetical protein
VVSEAKQAPAVEPKAAPVPVKPEAKPEVKLEAVAVVLAERKKPEQKPEPQKVGADSQAASQAAYQGPQVMDVPAFVEKWHAAWEKGDVDAYVSCYAVDAEQGTRTGRSTIRSHKRGLWQRNRPSQVVLTNMRILI